MPALLAVAAVTGYRVWQEGRTVLEFVRDGAPPPRLVLTVFPDQFSFAAPSPPPPLGELTCEDGSVVLDAASIPGRALVRYAGEGVGTGYVAVQAGNRLPPIRLGPPARLSGRVGEPQGVFVFGLRCLGLSPVAGARVLGLGGGEHGVLLCETTTGADGRFELHGFDAGLSGLGIRVLQPGFAVAHVDWIRGGDREGPIVPLLRTKPIRGRVAAPHDCDPGTLLVLAKGLPGVATQVAADGAFVLDHVPPDLEPRLLLYGLPERFTHGLVRASAGQEGVLFAVMRSATVRGYVVERASQRPVAGALVWHPHGPAGQITVESAADGSFVLPRVPPGEVVIGAQFTSVDQLGQKDEFSGTRRLFLQEGVDQDRILIEID